MSVEEPRRLRDLRGDRALSIRGLAGLAKVTTQTIVRIEAGEPMRPSTIAKLAGALDVAPMVILEYVQQRQRENETAAQD